MKLFTRTQYDQLIRNGSSANRLIDHVPVVKLHLPRMDCCWLLTELDPENPLTAFGLCDLGLGTPELGYADLSELVQLKLPLGVCLEPDAHFCGHHPISVYARAARECGWITEDPAILARHQFYIKRPGLYPA